MRPQINDIKTVTHQWSKARKCSKTSFHMFWRRTERKVMTRRLKSISRGFMSWYWRIRYIQRRRKGSLRISLTSRSMSQFLRNCWTLFSLQEKNRHSICMTTLWGISIRKSCMISIVSLKASYHPKAPNPHITGLTQTNQSNKSKEHASCSLNNSTGILKFAIS